jgi:RNA polymerase sigma-70 factor, ECF subfamily
MIELAAPPTGTPAGQPADRDRLDQLVSRIAAGDRSAFRRLYAFMAMRVWRSATAVPLSPACAVAVTHLTFVEVWHLAPGAARYDARDWIAAVGTRCADDRLRAIDVNGRDRLHPASHHVTAERRTDRPTMGDSDIHVHRELTALLGGGRITVRISPGVFTRIDDVDDAIPAIAAASGAPSTRER